MIDIAELLLMPEPRFLKHLGLSLYQVIMYEYWKKGIHPVDDQSILKRSDVEYVRIDLSEKEE